MYFSFYFDWYNAITYWFVYPTIVYDVAPFTISLWLLFALLIWLIPFHVVIFIVKNLHVFFPLLLYR